MGYKIKVLSLHPIFKENGDMISQSIGCENEHQCLIKSGYTYVILGAHDHVDKLIDLQDKISEVKYIILNSEPPESRCMTKKFIDLLRVNTVIDYHIKSSIYLRKVHRVICNSLFFFDFPIRIMNLQRDIDILFVGVQTQYRLRVFRMLRRKYKTKRIEFIMDGSLLNNDKLTLKLNTAKYVLNIPYYKNTLLETHRINKALSCGCSVVSMKSGDNETDQLYKDHIYFVDNIVNTFDYFGNNPTKEPYDILQKKLNDKYGDYLSIIKKISESK
jgi:hypothetical protein